MTAFFGFLLTVCLITSPVLAIIFLVKCIRKKPKKKIGVALLVSLAGVVVFTLLGVAFDPTTKCEHQYEAEKTIAATCTEEGYTSYHCPYCDDVEKKDKVVALEHDFNKTSVKEATEDSKGEIIYECSLCEKTKTEILDKLPKSEPTQESSKNETVSPEESETPSSDNIDTTVTYEEIYTAYKKNELRADETYQYNRYRVTAKINGMETGGLFNLTGGATLTMEVKIGNTIVFFYAEFEKEQEEKLKKINVGNTITFDGKCLSAGTWTECEIIEQ